MRDRRRRLRLLLVIPTAVVAWALLATVALASFTATVSASGDVSTAVLHPPTSLAATGGTCQADQYDSIALTWTATTSAWAEGYEVLRSTDGATYTVIATLTGASTESYTDSPLAFSTTYWYRVRAVKHAWTSQPAEVTRTTRGTQCLV